MPPEGTEQKESVPEELASILWGLLHPTPGPGERGETLGVLFAVTTGSSFCLFVCLMKLSPVKSICKQQEVYFSDTKPFPDFVPIIFAYCIKASLSKE